MYLVIDNYDSFVHNLARYFELGGVGTHIVRNDEITLQEIEAMQPEAIIISPGPKAPQQSGICIEAIKQFGEHTPILGVCLGHQAIGEAYGASTVRGAPIHGKASTIKHNGDALFDNLPSPLEVGRYHSLIIKPQESCPLEITAQTDEGEIMAVQHKSHPVYGVQFHPESILTPQGEDIVRNFIRIANMWNAAPNKEAA